MVYLLDSDIERLLIDPTVHNAEAPFSNNIAHDNIVWINSGTLLPRSYKMDNLPFTRFF